MNKNPAGGVEAVGRIGERVIVISTKRSAWRDLSTSLEMTGSD